METRERYAGMIDHTLLKPEATRDQFETLCREAIEWGFYSVCVHSGWISYCAEQLAGSPVKVCTVAGFPLGANDSAVKAFEAERAIALGAEEVDMVLNIGALKSGEDDLVRDDIRAVRAACRDGIVLKVIIETALLTDDEKKRASILVKEAGADFVKTSTGFSGGGATVPDVELLRAAVGPEMGVKAAGGVRSLADLEAMVAAGATRIGTSSGVKIFSGEQTGGAY